VWRRERDTYYEVFTTGYRRIELPNSGNPDTFSQPDQFAGSITGTLRSRSTVSIIRPRICRVLPRQPGIGQATRLE
jgi:hypothetical protein